MSARPGPLCGSAAVAVLVVLVGGCAARQPSRLSDRLVRGQDTRADQLIEWPASADAPPPGAAAVAPDLPDARPVPRTSELPTVEREDRSLAAALALIGERPSPADLRAAAAEYQRLGVHDRALALLQRALDLDRDDPRTRDALARAWRDSHVPAMALPEAYRAVHAAPGLAGPQNTLGTLLFALGDSRAAEARFERVVALDGRAAYALNNLCYVRFMQGDGAGAAEMCRAALRLDPTLTAARNNLALIHAAAGDWEAAASEFRAAATDEGRGQYNLGIAYLAQGKYLEAAEAFDVAWRASPSLAVARDRAREARRRAAAVETGTGGGG